MTARAAFEKDRRDVLREGDVFVGYFTRAFRSTGSRGE